MTMNKKIISLAVGAVLTTASQVASAALPVKVSLDSTSGAAYVCNAGAGIPPDACSFGTDVPSGSWFGMDGSGNGSIQPGEKVRIDVLNPLFFDDLTAATGSHPGSINGSETPVSDIWEFFGGTGMDYLTSAIIDNGNGTLGMTGWTVAWNGIPVIPMGGDTANFAGDTGLANIVCNPVDCSGGATYTLDYEAHVPLGDVSGFGGVFYALHLVGTVIDNNLAPTATAEPLATAMAPSTSILIDLPGNMTDPDGPGVDNDSFVISNISARAPTIEVCTGAATPNALCQAAGEVVYTDTAGTETMGTPDPFSYTVADGLGKVSAVYNVEVTITNAAIPPQTQPFSVLTQKDQAIDVDVVAQTTAGDNPIDPTTVNVTIENNGTTSVNGTTGVVTFTPTTSYIGTADFSYTVDDTLGNTSLAAQVTVTVNDPPVAGNTTVSVDRNSNVVVDVIPLTSDSDGTVDVATVMATPDVNGTAIADLTGRVTYTPTFGVPYIGPAQFTYTIDDNDGGTSSPGTVTVNIVNALPIAADDIRSIDTTVTPEIAIDVLTNDTDTDGTIDNTTVSISTNPANGNVVIGGTGLVVYTPTIGFVGPDTFTYTVLDNDGGVSNLATVSITVSDAADFCTNAPLAADMCFLQLDPGKNTGVTPVTGDGSYFTMETQPGVPLPTFLVGLNGLQINNTQPASTKPLIPNIDQPWQFFGNLGVHQTTIAPTVKSDDSNGNVILDLSGWNVSWNQIDSIPLGTDAHSGGVDGEAVMTCYSDDLVAQTPGDCSASNVYALDYYATVPLGDPSGFGGVKYRLHLEGTVAASGIIFSPSVPPNTTDIQAIDGAGNVVTVQPGSIAIAAGSTTGTGLTAADTGVTDPLLNPNDGIQCQGGCVDFVVTGFTGDYADIIYRLSSPLIQGAIYRKLVNGVWGGLDSSGDDQLGSNAEVAGACTDDQFAPGLIAGNQCIFLRIYDGGPNDLDGVKNGTIVDPGGALVAGSPNVPAGSTSGCSITTTKVGISERADWFIVAGFIVWLGLIGYRRNKVVN